MKGIVDFYGAVHFEHPSWNNPIPGLQAILPTNHLSEETLRKVYDLPAPIDSSVSLEGFQSDEPKPQRQSQPQEGTKEGPKPNFSNPRDCFAFTHLANGTVIDAIYPPSARDGDGGFKPVDPIMNITPSFPPTYIIHGLEDGMVSIDLSRALLGELEKNGVQCGMTEVPGEGHTFVAGMDVGSPTWERQLAGFEFLGGVIEASR